ncbi:diacylglycerol diphosphate phosphatase [Acrasis kona]|uniref:Diacylglycerol diphosphate phosphatase n=1 Tax=Acrasis kona TaxID=1008807 RepID=A0AAW2Z6Q6_9EUKA
MSEDSESGEYTPLVSKERTQTKEVSSLPGKVEPNDNRGKRFWFHDIPRPMFVRSKREMIAHYIQDYAAIFIGFIVYLAGVGLPYNEQFFSLNDPNFDRPVTDQVVPNKYAPFVFFFIPMLFLIVFHVSFVRHKIDFHHMLLGFFMANLISGIPTTTLWFMVGGLRPDFLADDCSPDMNKIMHWTGIRQKLYNDIVYFRPTEICMKKVIEFSFTNTPSFPSGHSSGAFASWLYVAIYVSNKVGAYKLSLGHVYKLLIMFTAIMLAASVGWTRILDHQHTALHITVGTLIGIPGALLGYRIKFCGLFTKDAHIPNYYFWKTVQNK